MAYWSSLSLQVVCRLYLGSTPSTAAVALWALLLHADAPPTSPPLASVAEIRPPTRRPQALGELACQPRSALQSLAWKAFAKRASLAVLQPVDIPGCDANLDIISQPRARGS